MQLCNTRKLFGQNFLSIQKLYSGISSELYKVKDSSNNIYAFKVFNKGLSLRKIMNEIKVGITLSIKEKENDFFIKYISSGSEPSSKRTYIVYEFIEKGTLKDKLLSALFFEEKMAKIVFWKITNEIRRLHKKGIVHMNITLDNILIDGNFNLKLGGFSSSQFVELEKDGQNTLLENDVFQLGVVLLQLITGRCDLKNFESKLLKIIQKGDHEKFWKIIETQNNQKFSKELKDLINIMLTSKSNRLQEKMTLDELINKAVWFQEIESVEKDYFMKKLFKQLEES